MKPEELVSDKRIEQLRIAYATEHKVSWQKAPAFRAGAHAILQELESYSVITVARSTCRTAKGGYCPWFDTLRQGCRIMRCGLKDGPVLVRSKP